MTVQVAPAELPAGALLETYCRDGGYVDCFAAEVPRAVSLPQLIEAFYTSRAFRPERWLLGTLLGKRSSNSDVARLAAGEANRFSAWSVEARQGDQILLCDYQGRTRSWLMVQPLPGGTRLHFGSAVVKPGDPVFKALLGFHRWYSCWLLRGAVRRLLKFGISKN
jgi:hypothetical protein